MKSLEKIPIHRSVTSQAVMRGSTNLPLRKALIDRHRDNIVVLVVDCTELVELDMSGSRIERFQVAASLRSVLYGKNS